MTLKFKHYLKQLIGEDWGENPDLYYKTPGASIWVFVSPGSLYWYNPEKDAIQRNSKVLIPIPDKTTLGKLSKRLWRQGNATHIDLIRALKDDGVAVDSWAIRGRSYRGDHQAWVFYTMTPKMWKAHEKAIDYAYRYCK